MVLAQIARGTASNFGSGKQKNQFEPPRYIALSSGDPMTAGPMESLMFPKPLNDNQAVSKYPQLFAKIISGSRFLYVFVFFCGFQEELVGRLRSEISAILPPC